jgi:hypothetical protein
MTPLSIVTGHTFNLREQYTTQIRRGTKPADHSELIGQRRGKLTCVDVLTPDTENRKSRLICSCECGSASTVRIDRFLSQETTSCRCIKIERFKAKQRRRAENLSASVVRDIFLDSARTGRWPGADAQVAARHDVPAHAVRAICQLHKERLLAKYGDTVRDSYHISRRALDKNLDKIEYLWLIKRTPRHDDDTVIEIVWSELSLDEQEMFASFAAVNHTLAA